MVSLHFCSIGEFEDSACHKMVHTHGKIGMLQVTEHSRDDRELILWRTGIHKRNLMTICLHHHKIEFCSTTSSLSSIKLFFVYKEQVTQLRETFETKWVQSTIHCQICRIFQTMWILNAVDISYSDILV